MKEHPDGIGRAMNLYRRAYGKAFKKMGINLGSAGHLIADAMGWENEKEEEKK